MSIHGESDFRRSDYILPEEMYDLEATLHDAGNEADHEVTVADTYAASVETAIEAVEGYMKGEGSSQADVNRRIDRVLDTATEDYVAYVSMQPTVEEKVQLASELLASAVKSYYTSFQKLDTSLPPLDDDDAVEEIRDELYDALADEDNDLDETEVFRASYSSSVEALVDETFNQIGVQNKNDMKRYRREYTKDKLREYVADGVRIAVGVAAVAAATHFLGRRRE